MIEPFVDAHHHLWDLQRNRHAWLQQDPPLELVCGSVAPFARTYGPVQYAADTDGLPLVASVAVEAGWTGAPDDEVRWLRSLELPRPVAVVAHAPLTDPHVGDLLDDYAATPEVTAIRHIAAWHERPRLRQTDDPTLLHDPTWRRNLRYAAGKGLAFDLQIYPHQVDPALDLVRAVPDLRVAVEHSLMPAEPGRDAEAAWLTGLRELAGVDTVVLKISGLGMCMHDASSDVWHRRVQQMVEVFGPSRCMFGSNYPVDSGFVTYRDVWQRFDEATAELSPPERADLFRQCASRFYGLSS